MTFWDPKNLRTVLGGSWLARPKGRAIDGVSTDTRSLEPGQIFFALQGEHFDAHNFLSVAAHAGASVLVVDRPEAVTADLIGANDGLGILKVASTIDALAHLAAAYRRQLDGTRVVAVTGSNGKTTTVRLIDAVLGASLRGTASIRSYNNSIGVSLTILAAKPGDQYLVCEVGMNAPGEIAPLARIIDPDVAVITSIGRAHLEAFDSVEDVAREKASLLGFLRANGLVVVNADAPHLADFLKPAPNVVRYGDDHSADLRLTAIQSDPKGSSIRLTVNDRSQYTVPLFGRHNALNAMAAIAVGRRFGLDDADIARGLEGALPADMRLNRLTIAGVDILNDAYNASPESTLAALDTFRELSAEASRRVMILGDMLELGQHAAAAHIEIAERILEDGLPGLLVTVGEHALLISERISRERPDVQNVILSELDERQAARIAERLQPGDAVLLKGSRRVGLERVIDALRRLESKRSNSDTSQAHATTP